MNLIISKQAVNTKTFKGSSSRFLLTSFFEKINQFLSEAFRMFFWIGSYLDTVSCDSFQLRVTQFKCNYFVFIKI